MMILGRSMVARRGNVCGDCCWPAPGGKCDCGGCFVSSGIRKAAPTMHGLGLGAIELNTPKGLFVGAVTLFGAFLLGTVVGPLSWGSKSA